MKINTRLYYRLANGSENSKEDITEVIITIIVVLLKGYNNFLYSYFFCGPKKK